jgi:hypothetical protein
MPKIRYITTRTRVLVDVSGKLVARWLGRELEVLGLNNDFKNIDDETNPYRERNAEYLSSDNKHIVWICKLSN